MEARLGLAGDYAPLLDIGHDAMFEFEWLPAASTARYTCLHGSEAMKRHLTALCGAPNHEDC